MMAKNTMAKDKVLFEAVVQPSPLVLFSSLPISAPFDNASLSVDSQLLSDSFIALLNDATHQIVTVDSKPSIYFHPSHASSPQEFNKIPPSNLLGSQDQLAPIRSVVLHLQSPNCRNTFIRFPPLECGTDHPVTTLGIRLPFLHLQIKPLGHTFMVQVGVLDRAGDRTTIRLSTFQTEARTYSKTTASHEAPSAAPQLIHLPLIFPAPKAHSQTSWTDLLIPLAGLLPTKYHSTDFIQVHANVRIRKIYFSADGKQPLIDRDRDWNQSRFSDDESEQVVNDSMAGTPFRPELILFRGQSTTTG